MIHLANLSTAMNFTVLDLATARSTRVFKPARLEEGCDGGLTIRTDGRLLRSKRDVRFVQVNPLNPNRLALDTDERSRRCVVSSAGGHLATDQQGENAD